MKQYYIILILTIGFFSCQKEEIEIDIDLQTYVDDFYFEAEKRGIDLSRKNLEVVFNDTLPYCGIGYKDFEGKGKRRVEINRKSACWQGTSELQKEKLIFQLLGRAVLEREYNDKSLPNGMPASILTINNVQQDLYTDYSLELREYYVDELFNSDEPVPEWAKLKTNRNILLVEDFERNTEDWKFYIYPENTDDSILGEINLNQDGDSKVAKITALEDLEINGLYAWSKIFQPSDIGNLSIGGNLQVNAKIKTKDLERVNGAGIQIVVVSGNNNSTTQSVVLGQIGRQNTVWDNTENIYSAQIGYYPSSVKWIEIHLTMNGPLKGEIEFDDIELVYYD